MNLKRIEDLPAARKEKSERMKFFNHDPGQIVCLISRKELKSYEIKSAEEMCNFLSPKVRDLIQDVSIAARERLGCELKPPITYSAQRTMDGGIKLEMKELFRSSEYRTETLQAWQIIDDAVRQHGCMLFFQSLSVVASYLRVIAEVLEKNKSIAPILYWNGKMYILDMVYIPEIQTERDDNKAFIHTVCAAVEYADRISTSDLVFKAASMMCDEHWKRIATCLDEFEMLMEFLPMKVRET